jgi:DNA-binding NarL/FixJ family response regulator
MSCIRVLIIEDEPLIAEDLASMLIRQDYEVCGIAYSYTDALLELELQPDIVLLDINLNGKPDGMLLAEQIHQTNKIPFLFITSYADKNTIHQAKQYEPSAYVVKPFSEGSLISSIEIALFNFSQRNKHIFPLLRMEQINQQIATPVSEREFELLQLIYDGRTNQQIADQLYISLNTVKKHINNAYLKLDCFSRASAITRLREMMQRG